MIVGDISHEAAVETLHSAAGEGHGLALEVDVTDPSSSRGMIDAVESLWPPRHPRQLRSHVPGR